MAKERLIDANEFEETHCKDCPYRLEGSCTKDDPICSTIQDHRDAPTVDAVEVVRCKDCIHYCQTHGYSHTYMGCMIFDGANEIPYETEPDDFCSHGERRSEDA